MAQKILNWYPMPNALNQSSQYNYQTQVSDTYPRKEFIYRGDYQISEKWRAYARYVTTSSVTNKNYGQWNADYNIPFSQMNFGDPGWSFIANVTTIINPTLTNEFIFGSSKNILNIDPVDDTFSRAKLNLSYTMPFPKADHAGTGAELALGRRAEWAVYGLQRDSIPQLQPHLRHHRQRRQGGRDAHVQGRHLLTEEPEGPDRIHFGQRQHLVRPRRIQSRRHELGMGERA